MPLPRRRAAWPRRGGAPGLLAGALVIGALVGCRLWLADTLPLTDTTEARFAEIARKMVETGDWLTPQHDYGVPYLAKPPLAFWLSAIGIELLGANELGPRVLIFGAAVAFCALFFSCARRWLGTTAAIAGSIMLISSFVFFTSMAAVMTDMILTVCVSSALLAFWRRYGGGSAAWEATMYVALGLGLLAKGPLAAVLFAAPIVAWSIATGRTVEVWRRFAWLKGALLAAAVAVPWYVAAELRNPGFLQYFIVGEHLQRFLVPGWDGDLYGRAHDAPRGAIWLMFLIGALPWSVLCVPALIAARAAVRRNWRERRELAGFALACAMTPLALFTLSGNVIWIYALPSLPAAVLAIVALTAKPADDTACLRGPIWTGALTAVAIAGLAGVGGSLIDRHTQRAVVAEIRRAHPARDVPIYYWRARYYSADYYGAGTVSVVSDPAALEQAIAERRMFCLVVENSRRQEVPDAVWQGLLPAGEHGSFAWFEPAYGRTLRFGAAERL